MCHIFNTWSSLINGVIIVGRIEDLPEGWACCVKREDDGRFKVQYVSKDGTCIQSKRQLHQYLEERGVPEGLLDGLVEKADFSQKFARTFILLNSTPDNVEQADTSRDELIAAAMQASYDRELGLEDDNEEDDPDFDSSVESVDSDGIGDVAAGGWRRRQSELEQETAADHDVSCLEIKTLESAQEGSCPVCQCDWEMGDEVRILPCEHQFHTQCIDQWLKKHKASCPLCKKDVREDWEDEEEEVWDPVSGTWKSATAPAAELPKPDPQ